MMYNEKVTLERENQTYKNPYKAYVNVVAEFSADGELRPWRIEWTDGRKYIIDRVLGHERMASRKAGGAGIRYLCEIRGQRVELYYEENYRWFVCRKHAG
jgi:hypothetical protein